MRTKPFWNNLHKPTLLNKSLMTNIRQRNDMGILNYIFFTCFFLYKKKEKFEDNKGVIRIRKSKKRTQCPKDK